MVEAKVGAYRLSASLPTSVNPYLGPELVAAVSNAGGIGVFGGIRYTPNMLRRGLQKVSGCGVMTHPMVDLSALLNQVKADLIDKKAPFGVDLLIPQIGGNARKTNYDYVGDRGFEDILVTVV